jgi:hypothetical protein
MHTGLADRSIWSTARRCYARIRAGYQGDSTWAGTFSISFKYRIISIDTEQRYLQDHSGISTNWGSQLWEEMSFCFSMIVLSRSFYGSSLFITSIVWHFRYNDFERFLSRFSDGRTNILSYFRLSFFLDLMDLTSYSPKVSLRGLGRYGPCISRLDLYLLLSLNRLALRAPSLDF